ncbi:MAG: hypothetical protein OEV30_01905 [Ignavibacteria bacterium]|nr:hypothetical protein [Ignavibacteria bacterium]
MNYLLVPGGNAKAYYRTPRTHGGGENSFEGLTLDKLTMNQKNMDTNEEGGIPADRLAGIFHFCPLLSLMALSLGCQFSKKLIIFLLQY